MTDLDIFQKIKLVGKSGICSDEDLMLILPNYPRLRGGDFIFSFVPEKYIDDEAEYFVKGLHIIEDKYAAKNSGSGFGSPSSTFRTIVSYAEYDYQKAVELEKWVALNSGNYYIRKISNPEEFRSQVQTKSMIKLMNERRQKEKEERKAKKAEARRIVSEQKIKIHTEKVKNDRAERDEIAKLPIEQLLIQILEEKTRPIYFFEEAILKIEKSQITEECKINVSLLIDKVKDKTNRKTRKLIKHLMTLNG